jgi:DNA-binding LacI/PurR family transcriptional regulator/signal transduction histidine kinase
VLFDSLLGACEEELWVSLSRTSEALDVNLLCFVGSGGMSEAGADDCEALYSLATPRTVDGLVGISSALGNHIRAEALADLYTGFHPLPVVSIGRHVPGVANILVESSTGVGKIVDHLVEVHGRRRIAFVCGPVTSQEAQERFAAYRTALERHGIPYRQDLVAEGDFRRLSAMQAVQSFAQSGIAFDALIGANDYMTLYAMRELQRRGVRVPEDVSVAGFDDTPEAVSVSPMLTTARQPLEVVGRKAIQLLLAGMRGDPVPELVVVPSELVVRRSCGCRPDAVQRPSPPSPSSAPDRRELPALAQALDARFPEVKDAVQWPTWAAELTAVLDGELRRDSTDRLGALLEELMARSDPRHGLAARWCEVVREAFGLLRPTEPAAVESWRAARESAVTTVGILAEQRQLRLRMLREEGYKAVVETFFWNAFFEEKELLRTLEAGLPELGIQSLFLMRYTDADHAHASLYFSVGSTEHLDLDRSVEHFPSSWLVPGRFSRTDRHTFVVLSLRPDTGQDGFALFETERMSSITHPSLVNELRRTLKMTALMKAVTRHAEELEAHVAERTRQLQQAQTRLVESAHQAGMAEVAVGALHNVGNLLSTVNIAAESIAEVLEHSLVDGLSRANALLEAHQSDLGAFFAHDARAQLLPAYYAKITAGLLDERARCRGSVADLLDRTSLTRETISTLQDYARDGLETPFREDLDLPAVVETSLELQAATFARHHVQVQREYSEVPRMVLPRVKVVHVLVNLLKNAVEAMRDTPTDARLLRIRVDRDGNRAQVRVSDCGQGISPEHLSRIFTYGFTTKADGHGFGLHSCVNHLKQIGGTLTVQSDGPGRGATFTVTFDPGALELACPTPPPVYRPKPLSSHPEPAREDQDP